MAIKVNTTQIDVAATKIANYNTNTRNAFSSVVDAINVLDRNWDGSAADNARHTFDNIQRTYCDQRYLVINDLVNFLRAQVSSDYQRTEANISKNAQAFK